MLVALLAGAFVFVQHRSPQALTKVAEIKISSKIIANFQVGNPDKKHFGGLRYVSGIAYWSDNEALGGISGFRIIKGGNKFLSVSDKGNWFTAVIERDQAGKITGLSNARIAPLLNRKGRAITSKRSGDAEGLEVFGDRALVSFERKSRINDYKLDLKYLTSSAKAFRPSIENIKLPNNNGLEAIVVLNPDGSKKLSRAQVAVFSEHSVDANGNIRGFISGNKKWKEFSVKAKDGYNITDATLLPDGNILLLERQFAITTGVQIRIRRIETAKILPGALLDGETVLEADSGFQIDNLEGISAWVNDNNQTMVTIVSDDNFSMLQRNLMLEFELLPPAGKQ